MEKVQTNVERNLRKHRIGVVVSDKMDKTIVVAIERLQVGHLFDTCYIVHTQAVQVKICQVLHFGRRHVSLGIEIKHVVLEVGVREVGGIDDERIVVADINVLVLDAVAVLVQEGPGAVAGRGSVWGQNHFVTLEYKVLNTCCNRVVGIVGGLERDVAGFMEFHTIEPSQCILGRIQFGSYIIKLHKVT